MLRWVAKEKLRHNTKGEEIRYNQNRKGRFWIGLDSTNSASWQEPGRNKDTLLGTSGLLFCIFFFSFSFCDGFSEFTVYTFALTPTACVPCSFAEPSWGGRIKHDAVPQNPSVCKLAYWGLWAKQLCNQHCCTTEGNYISVAMSISSSQESFSIFFIFFCHSLKPWENKVSLGKANQGKKLSKYRKCFGIFAWQ